MKSAGRPPSRRHGSFVEHDLDAEPYRSDKAGNDDDNNGLEGIALRLLDALAPASQMLKVRPQLLAVLFLDSERCQNGGDGLENHGVDVVKVEPLLFSQRLGDNRPDILVAHDIHRLMIRATFSNPRLAK